MELDQFFGTQEVGGRARNRRLAGVIIIHSSQVCRSHIEATK